ncbi:MAG: protein kinase [Planctomycetota bacterium]
MTTFAQPFEDYEILDRVGGGAMGTVFKARHKRLNRIVALKVLKPSLARDKRYVERLRREARIVASLSHPNIVTGYDLGEEGGYHFFVMEFVEGKSLRQLLMEWGMFAEDYVLKVARQVGESLDHAYQRDVIHRDIKPANILIDEDGSVKLTDMGLAKGPADLTLTRDGATVGTPMYISPEQARNPQDVDVRSDLYSLGATLYHMATGQPPFSGDTMAELITNVLSENVVPPDEANSAVSESVSLVIRKLLTKNLTLRYQTPREMLDDLDRIARAQPPQVDKNRLDELNRDANRLLRPILLVVSVTLIAFGAWWVGRRMVDPAPRQIGAEAYLQTLDQALVELPTPGARLQHLQALVDPPTGTLGPISQRSQRVTRALQRDVERVVETFEGSGWGDIYAWLHNQKVWPTGAQFERERLQPMLAKAIGMSPDELPNRVGQRRVESLRQTVARAIEQRDRELVARFEDFLLRVLPGRADDKARLGDFAAADRLWRDALPTFCDGVRQPLPEKLAEPIRIRIGRMLSNARSEAAAALGRAEQRVQEGLRDEVAATVADLRQRLAGGASPDAVGELLQRFRRDLLHFWPPSQSFLVGNDPWPEVDQQLMALQHALDLRDLERSTARIDARMALAWRAFVRGNADAGLLMVAKLQPAIDAQLAVLDAHRRALAAAQLVQQAVLKTIAARGEAPIAFPVQSLDTLRLRVEADGERLELFGTKAGQPARLVRLTELRLGDLLRVLNWRDALPLQRLPAPQRELGLAVLRLCSEDVAGLERDVQRLPRADRAFLFDRIWPLIKRARQGGTVAALDHNALFLELSQALEEVERGGSMTRLEGALIALKGARAEESCTGRQHSLLRRARARRDLLLRRRRLFDDLRQQAPRGSRVDVSVQENELLAAVTLPANVLHGSSGDGWQMRKGAVEFAGADRPWAEQPLVALRGDSGQVARLRRSQLELEISLPGKSVGRRIYLIEFYGISVAIVVSAVDGVHAAIVQGKLAIPPAREGAVGSLDEDHAQRAFLTAMAGAMAPPQAVAIAGGQHRLTIDVRPTMSRTQANVVVSFEGEPLVRKLHTFDPDRRPSFALHPLQEVTVHRATVRTFGR